MARYPTVITTEFDQFMHDLMSWLDTAWYVWVAMALMVVLFVAVVIISKVRARTRRRVPQYRRQA